jgi:Trp operon repressor
MYLILQMQTLLITVHTKRFQLEERRRQVASMLAQSNMNELQIAKELNVDHSTISRDIKVLKEMSNSFTYYLAESNLSHYYRQQFIEGIEEMRAKVSDLNKTVNDIAKRLDRIDSVIGVDSSVIDGDDDGDKTEEAEDSDTSIVDDIMKATAEAEAAAAEAEAEA